MQDIECTSSLIGSVYDAALDPLLWSGALRKARDFVGGSAAALFSKDVGRSDIELWHDDGGLGPEHWRLYLDLCGAHDPFAPEWALEMAEEPRATAELCHRPGRAPRDPQRMKSHGRIGMVSATVEKSAAGEVLFGIFRNERDGVADEETHRRMRLVVPHLRRAVLIGRALDRKTAEAARLADALDGLSAGLFLIGEMGRIVHANSSGQAMLNERGLLRAGDGKLVVNDVNAGRILSRIFAQAASGDAAISPNGNAVPLKSRDGEHYVAHVLPLTSDMRPLNGRSHGAVAILFVHRAKLAPPSRPEALAEFYGMTPSELRVLLAIVEVGGVPETADTLGIAATTVRTHLHRLFSKTGATRQADLVKLIAGFSSPFVERRQPPPPMTRANGNGCEAAGAAPAR